MIRAKRGRANIGLPTVLRDRELESVRACHRRVRSPERRRFCLHLQRGGGPLAPPPPPPAAQRDLVRSPLPGRLAGGTPLVSGKHSPSTAGSGRPVAVC